MALNHIHLLKDFTSEHFDISIDQKGLTKLYKLLTDQAASVRRLFAQRFS